MSGFSNWKDAPRYFTRHDSTHIHKAATDLTVNIPLPTSDVGDMLSFTHAKEKASNQKCFIKIAKNIKYLAKQRSAFHGDGDEGDSKFTQLMHLHSLDDSDLPVFLSKKTNKYTSTQIQNEISKIMSLLPLQHVFTSVQASKYFAVVEDKVIDSASKEQFVICLHCVDDNLQPNEDFIGLYHVQSIQADVLVHCLKDCMLHLNINLHSCCGQCYDGAGICVG